MNPFDLVYEQYRRLKKQLYSTSDPQEKNILFKRLVNLLAVMEFLISLNNASWSEDQIQLHLYTGKEKAMLKLIKDWFATFMKDITSVYFPSNPRPSSATSCSTAPLEPKYKTGVARELSKTGTQMEIARILTRLWNIGFIPEVEYLLKADTWQEIFLVEIKDLL